MDQVSIRREWRSAFGEALPAGFSCRRMLPERWMRIHSLEEAKRYASSPLERQEVLKRHTTIADYVLGDGARCLLFITRFGKQRQWSASERSTYFLEKSPVHVMSYHDDEDACEFFASEVRRDREQFNELIFAAADDNIGPILFANLITHCAYAPYDGGADLFLATPGDVPIARDRFSGWLSKRSDGM